MAGAAMVPARSSATMAHADGTSMRPPDTSRRTTSASPIPAYAHASGTRNNNTRAGGARRVTTRSSAVHPSTVRARARRRARPSRGSSAPKRGGRSGTNSPSSGNRYAEPERIAHVSGERRQLRDKAAERSRHHVLVPHQRRETRANDHGRVRDGRQHARQQDRCREARKQSAHPLEPGAAPALDDDPQQRGAAG
jgi:hypothetical protein